MGVRHRDVVVSSSAASGAPAAGPVLASASVTCIDLDGTLLAADLFWESLLVLLKSRPRMALWLPFWLVRGKAYLKRQIALHAPLDVRTLPYRPEVLAFIEEARASGQQIVLATAADASHASAVASHLGLFADVIASDGVRNLSGHRKATCLRERFGTGQFEYVGNDWVDVPTWRAAGRAIVVAAPRRLLGYLTSRFDSVRVLVPARTVMRPGLRALRPHQWVKNVLVFVPLIASHRILELSLVASAIWTFLAFSLCASSIYVANDLLDIQADRAHPRKRLRPFASGELSVPVGLVLSVGLFLLSLTVAIGAVSVLLSSVLAIYAAISLLYSIKVKREPVLDVFLLAGLYVLRIFAGGIATGIDISSWLLALGMFLFLNLALVKRYTELSVAAARGGTISGRNYQVADAQWMQMAGICAGCVSVLVLALYAAEPEVTTLYRAPAVLLLLCPLLLYWIVRMWFGASRGTLEDDPVLVAVRDPASYIVAIGGALILFAAR
jgi:4-hydroxybenzoate polyprenyltransferase